jgi:hypothetical protein
MNGVRSVLGCPVFFYESMDVAGEESTVWATLKAADDVNYYMAASTAGSNDQMMNQFNIPHGHQYSLISVFELKNQNTNLVEHRLYMLRNPWDISTYNGTWSHTDPAWTAHYKSQVPYGVDPTTSN